MLLVACVQQLNSSNTKVNTQWTYINKNDNAKSLPDFIQLELEFESYKITLNLIKQSLASIKTPLIITQFEGQRSEWKSSDDELLGIYKDPSFDASATVNVNKFDGRKGTLYMITFTHGNKSFSLEPSSFFNPSLYKTDQNQISGKDKKSVNDIKSNNYMNKIKPLNIDGRLHSLIEVPTTKSYPSISLDGDRMKNLMKETRLWKRSTKMTVQKRLMTVEIFTVIDYTIFNTFFNVSKAKSICKKKQEARRNILYLFTHIMEGVKIVYENIKMEDLKFTTKWVGALITESMEDASFIKDDNSKIDPQTINATLVLRNMRQWSLNVKGNDNTKLPNFDYLALFTRNRIISGRKAAVGVANRGICLTPVAGIIQWSDIFSDIAVTAHELGHSLDMNHDGESYGNDCDPEKDFVMSAQSRFYSDDNVVKNNYLFSKCSLSYLNDTVNRLDRNNSNCLEDGGDDFNRGPERDIFLHLYPGQIYELDDQCRMFYGQKSFYCGGKYNDWNICQFINCFNGTTCLTLKKLKAMDGTTCGNRSWCFRGECVTDSKAPRASNTCINGDFKLPPFKNQTELYCHNIRKDAGFLCSHEDAKERCCASCKREMLRNTIEDCQDILEECPSLEPRDCYSNYYATTCCKTCHALVQNPSDVNCLYGDKGVGCLDLVPTVCHLSPTRFCCKTCSAYFSSFKTTNTSSAFLITESISSAIIPPVTIT